MNRIPRTVRWVLAVSLLFLVAMTLARVFSWYVFHTPGTENEPLASVFWLGARYDARMVAIFAMVMLLLSAFRQLNPFRHNSAKKGWRIFLVTISILLTLFYVVDFLHYRYLNQRLNASALAFLEDAKISVGMVWQTYPVLRLLIAIVVMAWVL